MIGGRRPLGPGQLHHLNHRPLLVHDDAFYSLIIYSMPAMFFSGTLQEGIALAVSQAKAVICFVRGSLSPAFPGCLFPA